MNRLKTKSNILYFVLVLIFLSCDKIEDTIKKKLPQYIIASGQETVPKVIASVPAQGQTGVAKDQTIIITFNKEMEQQTCINAFTIQPPMTGLYEFVWNVMYFKPSSRLKGGITYVANISKRCEDRSGRDIEKPFSLSFTVSSDVIKPEVISVKGKKNASGCTTTSPYVQIINYKTGFYDNKDVCQNTPLVIDFTKVMNRTSVESNFLLAPTVSGSFAWSNNDQTLEFTPRDPFKNATTYVGTVSVQAEDITENTIEKNVSFSFTIGSNSLKPDVVSIKGRKNSSGCTTVSPYVEIINYQSNLYNNKDVCRNSPLRIDFTRAMNRVSIESNFLLAPAVSGSFTWSNNNQTLDFTPKDQFENALTYVGTISAQAEDSTGTIIEKNVSFSFTVGSESVKPIIVLTDGYIKNATGCSPGSLASSVYTTALQNSIGVCSGAISGFQNTPIYIHFSESMDLSTTDSAISISPSINGIKSWSTSTNSQCGTTGACGANSLLTFTPTEQWQNAVTYTLTISGAASDIAGNDVGINNTTAFTIGNDFKIPKMVFQDGTINGGAGCNPGVLASTIDPVNGIRDKQGFCSSNMPGNTNSSIVIDFSEDMDITLTNLGFSISPNIIGVKSWSTSTNALCGTTGICGTKSRLTFTPNQPWQPTQYTVSFSGAKDTDGNALASGSTFSFNVGTDFDPPDVLAVNPFLSDLAPICAGAGLTTITNYGMDVCYLASGTKIRIRFDEPMNQAITSGAFSISPSVNGILSWPTTTELLYTPSQNLELFRQYKISINTSAKDLAGNNFVSEFVRYFTTGDGTGTVDSIPPTVTNVLTDLTSGVGGCNGGMNDSIFTSFATNICTDNGGSGLGAIFEIQFSEAMTQTTTAQSATISPSISGVFSWPTVNTLRFSATQSLDPDKQYTITINQNASDTAGNKLQTSYSSFFRTSATGGAPGITSINVSTGTVAVCAAGTGAATNINTVTVTNACQGNPSVNPIIVTFTEPMNQSKTQNSFSLSPSVAGVFSWPSTTQMIFTPDTSLEYGKRYSISISTSAEDLQAQRLQTPINASFVVGALDTTAPNLSCPGCGVDFETTTPGDGCVAPPNDFVNQQTGSSGTTNVCLSIPFIINFSEDMNQSATVNAISISPSVNMKYTWTAGNILTATPLSSFSSNTTYTITVSTTARDLAGNTLSSDFIVSFKTENISPIVAAVGLESHGAGCSVFGSVGGNTGYTAGNCWWDNSTAILAPSNYLFQGGNSVCGTDANTDNIRIIFNKAMDTISTASAISLRRISPPTSNVIKASWVWSDGDRVITISFSESIASPCGGNAAGAFDLYYNAAIDLNSNYPFYNLEIDQSAKDKNGVQLNAPFSFIIEGN